MIILATSLLWLSLFHPDQQIPYSLADQLAFITCTLLVSLLQALLLYLLSTRTKLSLLVSRVTVAGLLTLNAWFLYLILLPESTLTKKILLTAAIFIAMLAICMMATRSGRLALFTLVIAAAVAFLNFIKVPSSSVSAVPTLQITTTAVHQVDFVLHPNVYLLGFLSATPAAVLEKNLSLSGAALPQALIDNRFRVFRNTFSEAFPTRNSYDMLLSMDREYAAQLKPKERGKMFSGRRPSPLIQIFQHNGYEVTTLTEDYKFGPPGGHYVEHYLVNNDFSLCQDNSPLDTSLRNIVFFGGCLLRNSTLFPVTQAVAGPPAELLLSHIPEIAASPKPQLIIAHLKPPIHAPDHDTFRGTPEEVARFRKHYKEASLQAADHLNRLTQEIVRLDPTAIILAFGDQGVRLSISDIIYDNPAYGIPDAFAVMAGIYPADACKSTYDVPFLKNYHTTPELIRLLVKCLAGGVDAYSGNYVHYPVVDGQPVDVSRYLYE